VKKIMVMLCEEEMEACGRYVTYPKTHTLKMVDKELQGRTSRPISDPLMHCAVHSATLLGSCHYGQASIWTTGTGSTLFSLNLGAPAWEGVTMS
jgi:hypothetical protein